MNRLPTRTKLIFGSADLFGGGALSMVGFYYLIFLTDILQIRPALAGAIILMSKAWDAVSDPLMGVLTDRTRSRIGRRRPYFFAAVVTVFLAMMLLWNPVDFGDPTFQFMYALISYVFFSTVSTTVMIPYLSMQPELTSDYQERTSLNVYKMGFSFIGGILAALVPLRIIGAYTDIQQGWRTMAVVFAAVYALPWIGIALHIKERDNRSDPAPPAFRLTEFIAPLRIRTFRILIAIYLGAFLAMDIMSSVFAYFITYVYGHTEQMSTVLGSLIVSQLLFLPILGRLTRHWDKNRVLIACAAVWMISISVIAFMPRSTTLPGLVALAFLAGIGVCGSVVLPWTMYPDTTDVGRLATGLDRAGSFSGLMTFFRKMASALALFLVGFFLELAGYIKPLRSTVEGVTVNINQIQSKEVLLTIRLLLCLMPLLLLGGVILLAHRYPLTRNNYRRLRAHLDSPGDESEKAALKELLV